METAAHPAGSDRGHRHHAHRIGDHRGPHRPAGTYGSLATVIIFLVWLWISNLAILLGAEFDAEVQRGRAIQAGHPPQADPYLQPGDQPKRPNNQNL